VAHVFLESFHSTNSGNALTEIRRIDSNQKRLLIGFIYHRIKQTVTMKLFFFVTGQIGMTFGKNASVLYTER